MTKDKPPVTPREEVLQAPEPPEPPVIHMPPDAPSLEELAPPAPKPPEPPVIHMPPDAPSPEELAPPDQDLQAMAQVSSDLVRLHKERSLPQRQAREYTEAEIIAANQTILESNVSSYLKEKPPRVTSVSEPVIGLLELSDEESFRKAIEYCSCEYDKVLGIKWRIIGDHLIRDAREQSQTSIYTNKETGKTNAGKSADTWAYTGQFLNSCRAARIVVNLDDNISQNDKEIIIREISALANKAFNVDGKPQIISESGLKSWNTEVAKIVYKYRKEIAEREERAEKLTDAQRKKYRIDDTVNDIMSALDCAGLEDNHYHLTTISQVKLAGKKSVNLIETSQKLSGQTLQIKNEMGKIASGAGSSVAWFNALAPFDKKIIQESCRKILEAQGGYFKVIPTQFMEKMAGLRNAYLEARYTQRENEDPKMTLQSFRSSTPSFHGKSEAAKVDVTKGNIDYLNSLDNEGVCLNILFTPTPVAKIERDASLLLNNLSDNLAETPTNIVRSLQGSRDLSGFDDILKNIIARLNYIKILPVIKNYIATGEKDRNFDIYLKGWLTSRTTAPAVKEAILNLIECRNLMDVANWGMVDVHYNLAARMAAAVHDAKRGVLFHYMNNDVGMVKAHPVSEIDAFCKSGKDRTGIEERVLADLGYNRNILVNEGVNADSAVYIVTVRAGHQQALNGRNGGTPLCFGVKGQRAPSMPDRYRGEGFARDTADTNKFPCEKLNDKSIKSHIASPRGSSAGTPRSSSADSPKSLSTSSSRDSDATPLSTPHADAVRQSESPKFHFADSESHADAVRRQSQADESERSHVAATRPNAFKDELRKSASAMSSRISQSKEKNQGPNAR